MHFNVSFQSEAAANTPAWPTPLSAYMKTRTYTNMHRFLASSL